MSTIKEFEAAIIKLPTRDRQRLLRIITASLDGESPKMPEPREFSTEQINQWIAKDEEAMRKFNAN